MSATSLPGSRGEHELQQRLGTFKRAAAFYDKQMLDHINPVMREYIARQEMAFIATHDGEGGSDCSFRAGPPGFMRVLDDRTLLYPELPGNGVMASLGNLTMNPHIGILFVDFFEAAVGLHVNGVARIVGDDALAAFAPMLERMLECEPLRPEPASAKMTPERWVLVEVEEAYIHCSKHIPLLSRREEEAPASGDFFRAKASPRPWSAPEAPVVPASVEAAAPAPAPPAAPTDWSNVAESARLLADVAAAQAAAHAPVQ